jgi:hypothetical protein
MSQRLTVRLVAPTGRASSMLPNRFMRWRQRRTAGEAPRCSAGPATCRTCSRPRKHGAREWVVHSSRPCMTNLTAMALYDKVAERSGFLVYRKRL